MLEIGRPTVFSMVIIIVAHLPIFTMQRHEGKIFSPMAYSVVGAITQFWLAARAEGLGLGWVSILDPARLAQDLAVPPGWRLIGYLCLGFPEEDSETPELERAGWESRAPALIMETR